MSKTNEGRGSRLTIASAIEDGIGDLLRKRPPSERPVRTETAALSSPETPERLASKLLNLSLFLSRRGTETFGFIFDGNTIFYKHVSTVTRACRAGTDLTETLRLVLFRPELVPPETSPGCRDMIRHIAARLLTHFGADITGGTEGGKSLAAVAAERGDIPVCSGILMGCIVFEIGDSAARMPPVFVPKSEVTLRTNLPAAIRDMAAAGIAMDAIAPPKMVVRMRRDVEIAPGETQMPFLHWLADILPATPQDSEIQISAMKALLDAGATVSAPNGRVGAKETPLHAAARIGANLPVVRLLANGGAFPAELVEEAVRKPSSRAAKSFLSEATGGNAVYDAVLAGNTAAAVEIVRSLGHLHGDKAVGFFLNGGGKPHRAPLGAAVRLLSSEVVEGICSGLPDGLDINGFGLRGRSPLADLGDVVVAASSRLEKSVAKRKGKEDASLEGQTNAVRRIAKALVASGCDPRKPDVRSGGASPLEIASSIAERLAGGGFPHLAALGGAMVEGIDAASRIG